MNKLKKTTLIATLLINVICISARTYGVNTPDNSNLKGLDAGFEILHDVYPTYRYLDGSISFFTGTASTYGGIKLLVDGSYPSDEGIVAYLATGVGIMTMLDGIHRFFAVSDSEYLYLHYHSYPAGKPIQYGGTKDKLEYGEATLADLASGAKQARILRGVLDLISAGNCFYLYHKGERVIDANGNESGKDIYPKLIYPGAFMALLAAYRIIFSTPEEKAWNNYSEGITNKQKRSASLNILPMASFDHVFLSAILRF